ncbi:MAG: Epimerase protein [Patescibacteria group bacterium]|nr:Epimerase protein [Patescibacteria group bacterium]
MAKQKKMKVFITGGEGFIGSSLTSKLLALGHDVATYDCLLTFINNQPYFQRSIEIRRQHFKQPQKKYSGDIRDYSRLKYAIEDFNPDIIVHLAGLPMARVLPEYADQMAPINMQGTLNVTQIFEKSSATRLVYTSSSMAYGHFKQTPQTESFILDPTNEYGACKAAGEYFVKLSEKEWVIVRPTSVYGLADAANRVTQLLLDAAHLNKPAWVVEGETLDFSYIEDVTDGFVLLITKPEANHETFNISRGEARSAAEFAKIVKKLFPKLDLEIRQPSKQQVWRGPLDISKAKSMLGFESKYSIEDGIAETVELINRYEFYKGL